MERHRKCEACDRGTCTEPKATYSYLKRRSVSSIISRKSTKSSRSDGKRSSYIDPSADDAEEMRADNPALKNTTHLTADQNADTDDTEFNERIEAAKHKLSELLIEALEPLAETSVTPAQDPLEEHTDREAAVLWAEQNEQAEQTLKNAEQNIESLLKDVNAATDAVYDRISANPVDDCTISESAPAQILKPTLTHVKENLSHSGSTNEHNNSGTLVVPVSERPAATPPQPVLSTKPAVPVAPPRTATDSANKATSAKSTRKQSKQPKNDGWHTLWSFNVNAKW